MEWNKYKVPQKTHFKAPSFMSILVPFLLFFSFCIANLFCHFECIYDDKLFHYNQGQHKGARSLKLFVLVLTSHFLKFKSKCEFSPLK